METVSSVSHSKAPDACRLSVPSVLNMPLDTSKAGMVPEAKAIRMISLTAVYREI